MRRRIITSIIGMLLLLMMVAFVIPFFGMEKIVGFLSMKNSFLKISGFALIAGMFLGWAVVFTKAVEEHIVPAWRIRKMRQGRDGSFD